MSKPAPPPYSPPGVPVNNLPNPPYPTGAPYHPTNAQYNQGPYRFPVSTQPTYQEMHFHPPQGKFLLIKYY